MTNFNLYAQYYDLLYRDKDYAGEVAYVDKLIRKYSSKDVVDILNLGCGTGKHDNFLSKLGYKVDGVDLSKEMIAQAKKNFGSNSNLTFYEGNINSWVHAEGKQYDVVISLFHVLSYQTENDNVLNTFKTAYHHLNPGGIFLYDCWYGQGVLSDRPAVRVKRLENDQIKVQRISEPVHHPGKNIVDVNFDVQIFEKQTGKLEHLNEVHKMRYFFLPELSLFSAHAGFDEVIFYEWLTDHQPGEDTWNIIGILAKPIQ